MRLVALAAWLVGRAWEAQKEVDAAVGSVNICKHPKPEPWVTKARARTKRTFSVV